MLIYGNWLLNTNKGVNNTDEGVVSVTYYSEFIIVVYEKCMISLPT